MSPALEGVAHGIVEQLEEPETMQNFTFHNPTRIVFGRDTIKKIGPEASAFGRKALLVHGRSSLEASGIRDRIVSSLAGAGIEIVEFSGVSPNPRLSHLRRGVEKARAGGVEMVIAAGGGSVIDEAKAIAAGVHATGDVWDFFTGAAEVEKTLPVLCVLTLAAAGSEMNGGAVITNDETCQKLAFMSPAAQPRVSILDPTATFTVSPEYTAYSAVDSMSHLLEGYFTQKDSWTPVQDRYVEGLVSVILASTDRILEDPGDYEARASMMWAATLAWNGLALCGTGEVNFPNHMIAHALGALHDVPHGAALSIVLPAWMTWAAGRDAARFAGFARQVLHVDNPSPDAAAAEGIARLKAWFESIGAPTSLSAGGIPADDLSPITDNALMMAEAWAMPEYTRSRIEEILELCV